MKKTLGNRIKVMRENAEMSQQAVANEVGVSRVAVTKWESGDTKNLKFENLIGLMRLFRVSFDELVNGTDPLPQHYAEAAALLKSLSSDRERDEVLHAMRLAAVKLRDRQQTNEVEPLSPDPESADSPKPAH